MIAMRENEWNEKRAVIINNNNNNKHKSNIVCGYK